MRLGCTVFVESTGLEISSKDEWHKGRPKLSARRICFKLHLAMGECHQVLTYELTTSDVGYPTAVPDLIEQISTPFEGFLGDGAYHHEHVSQTAPAHQPDAKVIILRPKSAVSLVAGDTPGDQHIKDIAEKERITRQCETGYGLRSNVELALQRFKSIFGNTIKKRVLPLEKTEARNVMTNLAMPISVKG